MNNNNLIKIINLYGGKNNESESDSSENKEFKKYTESLLEIYGGNVESDSESSKNKDSSIEIYNDNKLLTKLNNLKMLLINETKNEKNNLKYLKKII